MRTRYCRGWVLGLVGALGCYPVYMQPGEETSSSSSGSGSATAMTTGQSGAGVTSDGVGVTTGGASTGSSSGGSGSSTGSTGDGLTFIVGTGDGLTFIVGPDNGGGLGCDTLAQDCPPGQKCTYYAKDGSSWWHDTKCVPVMEYPSAPGEPCMVFGDVLSGIDDCEKGSMCWDANVEGKGMCTPLCAGEWGMLECPPGWTVGYARDSFCICFDQCDPLVQDCPEGDTCLGAGDGFICTLDASGVEGQWHDPCDYGRNTCDPGLLCLGQMSGAECVPFSFGCCQPFCDLTKPNTCPGQGQVCVPYYEGWRPPPGYEDVGVCTLPG